jgi:hypothetical protein
MSLYGTDRTKEAGAGSAAGTGHRCRDEHLRRRRLSRHHHGKDCGEGGAEPGVTLPVLQDKEEILVSAIVAHADYFAKVLQEVCDNRENTKDQLLEKLWECFQKFYEKDPATFTAWQYFHQSDVIGNLPTELRDILHEAGAKVVALQHQIVQYAVAQKVFIHCDPKTLSEVIWSSFLGIIYIYLGQLDRLGRYISAAILHTGVVCQHRAGVPQASIHGCLPGTGHGCHPGRTSGNARLGRDLFSSPGHASGGSGSPCSLHKRPHQ